MPARPSHSACGVHPGAHCGQRRQLLPDQQLDRWRSLVVFGELSAPESEPAESHRSDRRVGQEDRRGRRPDNGSRADRLRPHRPGRRKRRGDRLGRRDRLTEIAHAVRDRTGGSPVRERHRGVGRLPGVDARLQDHPDAVIVFETTRPTVRRSTQYGEAGILTPTGEGLDRPDLTAHYGSAPFDLHTLRQRYPTAENTFCLAPNATCARSPGTARMRLRDFRDEPRRVDPRYFTDTDGRDMRSDDRGTAQNRRERRCCNAFRTGSTRNLAGAAGAIRRRASDYIGRTHQHRLPPDRHDPDVPGGRPDEPPDPDSGSRAGKGSASPTPRSSPNTRP